MSDERFAPEGLPDWQLPFWDALRTHTLRVQQCSTCGRYRFIPKEMCPSCHHLGFTWEPVRGTGEIYTYTVIHRPPTPAYQADVPYTVVHVTMDDGFRMVGRLIDADRGAADVGQQVEVAYDDLDERWTLLGFRRA